MIALEIQPTFLSPKIGLSGVTYRLENQAPFIKWDSPADQTTFPSQSEVLFNASRSWDLDDDLMTFTWTSSIDGQLLQGLDSEFTANGITAPLVGLSDGIHDITLQICDDKGNCVDETRTIELSNQPPIIVVSTDPQLTPWGELSYTYYQTC